MDLPESTKVVFDRVVKIEPDNVSKILGYLLLQEHSDRTMLRLAFSPDNMLHSIINKAKTDLGLSSIPAIRSPISPPQADHIPLQFVPFSSRPISSPAGLPAANSHWDPQVTIDQPPVNNFEFMPPPSPPPPPPPLAYSDSVAKIDYRLRNQHKFLSFEDHHLDRVTSVNSDFSSSYYFPEATLGPRASRRSPSLPEFPFKVCHYFNKGYCKHGNNCRYFHGLPVPESFSQMLNSFSNEVLNEDHGFSPGSFEKLEFELTELLKSRRGFPVSIASLPMLYYEKYGRTLQAEGYLTESQRHGKAGYSLTKLLARMKNSIRLIDRPHGQHSVILAEDFPKFMEFSGERCDHGGIVAGSHQIYLTFPAESTFTEQDVSNYFNKFGPVQDVRIPCQPKRMFGFVTFVFAETVRQILMKGNPHYVCGARILVKPYREKSRLDERKYNEKVQHSTYCSSHLVDPDSEFHSSKNNTLLARIDNAKLVRKHFMEEHDRALELERRHFSELQLARKAMNHFLYSENSLDGLKLSEARKEQSEFRTADSFNHFLEVRNIGSAIDDEVKHINTKPNDQESQGFDLPDSPFATPIELRS